MPMNDDARPEPFGQDPRSRPDPHRLLTDLEAESMRYETPCGNDRMVWHMWNRTGRAAPVVVLFHGGAGSWRHWVRNIPVLAARYRVLVPDLPGLGDSDFPPDGDDEPLDDVHEDGGGALYWYSFRVIFWFGP